MTAKNSVHLTGNLGADVHINESNGVTYTHLSLATNYRVKTDDGWDERVTWTRVTAFNGLARSLAPLGKGSLITLRGHLETTVTERDGVSIEHSQVIADEIDFLRVKKPAAAADDEAPAEETAAA